MRLLLDTHALIWMTENSPRMSRRASDLIRSPDNGIAVSAASAWEIAYKVQRGKLQFNRMFLADFDTNLRALSFSPLAITAAHACAAASLPGAHNDPFDRILAGQAAVENLTVLTVDPAFRLLGIETVWE